MPTARAHDLFLLSREALPLIDASSDEEREILARIDDARDDELSARGDNRAARRRQLRERDYPLGAM